MSPSHEKRKRFQINRLEERIAPTTVPLLSHHTIIGDGMVHSGQAVNTAAAYAADCLVVNPCGQSSFVLVAQSPGHC